ncbi:MAG TPA: hypothetical protein DIV54_07100 [Verrucomicrobiales bacterium]|nr:hypothetical protein [Roseibacillus sp.]HCQ33252.1 hypothetical protein [Verrucomicrobiales bacterium]
MREPIRIETDGGLYLPGLELFLDLRKPRENGFISHAHADHFARHENILCSEATARILKARYNVADERLNPRPFHEPLDVGPYSLQLLPAGHVYGSSMLHITRKSDGESLLYTGDFKVRASLTAEDPVFRRADTLIMETTFGSPEWIFPGRNEITGMILNFVNECLEEEVTPTLLAYSLGKAQEAHAILFNAGIPAVSHPTVAKMTTACREAGCPLSDALVFEGTVPPRHAFICPPNALRSEQFRAMPNLRTAMLSGWALKKNATYRFGVDAAFPLSDHADFPGLLEAVGRVRPKRVVTVHGYTREFAAELRRRNHEAWSAGGGDQMEFDLNR